MTKTPEPAPPVSLTTPLSERLLTLLVDDAVGSLIRRVNRDYLYWDKVKYQRLPHGLVADDFWSVLKVARLMNRHSSPVRQADGRPFWYSFTDELQRSLMVIDQQAGGSITSPTPEIPRQERTRYLISNLMEEAIASSQIEGAATTRAQAKDMLRSGRAPATRAERMVSNNYHAISRIKETIHDPVTPGTLLELQATLTEGTCDDPRDSGRFRRDDDRIVVGGREGQAVYVPPPARVVDRELERLCAFANSDAGEFVHPVVKAAMLHFWLAFLHPFCDGNGRTARALFYFYMLRSGYWLFEYLSISRVIHRRRTQYERAFLCSELDDCDLTYFLTFHLHAIETALGELRTYLAHQVEDDAALRSRLSRDRFLNHRQRAVLGRALADPSVVFTIQSHQASHDVAYATARADLIDLATKGYLVMSREGHAFTFSPTASLRVMLKD